MNTLKLPLLEEVGNMVSQGVVVVFDTMLKTEITPVSQSAAETEAIIVGSIGFVGEINGMVHLRLPVSFAGVLASRMLALPQDALDESMINDVVAEVSNMIVGSVKSQLCDTGFPCALTIPSVVRGQCFRFAQPRASERLLLNFKSENQPVLVELLVKQT